MKMLKVNDDVLLSYMSMAPLALAFERYLECKILKGMPFPSPVLDLGCGDGVFAHVLFADQIHTGIDHNSRELARAQQLNAHDELLECPGHAVPKPNAYYRTILSNSVLEHIPDLEPVLREIHRLLAPNGRFYMTVPAPNFEQYTVLNQILLAFGFSRLAAWYRQFCSNVIWRQFHYYSREGWEKVVSDYGFKVVESFTYDPKAMCLLNNFLYPFGIVGIFNKKIFNRWTLLPFFRQVLFYPLYIVARRIFENLEKAERGGLVFLALTK